MLLGELKVYAQVTNLTVPIGKMNEFRELVHREYFKNVQDRDGFCERASA